MYRGQARLSRESIHLFQVSVSDWPHALSPLGVLTDLSSPVPCGGRLTRVDLAAPVPSTLPPASTALQQDSRNILAASPSAPVLCTVCRALLLPLYRLPGFRATSLVLTNKSIPPFWLFFSLL